jgi:hypothetical protein
VDDSDGTPELLALDPGQAFDPQAGFALLNDKAYNAQYGWNAGGFFTIPPGAAIWIEQTAVSPGLEVYEGWGRYGSYTPIFGTAGSSPLWKWSGVMVHNSYAVLRPTASRYFAEYHIFFGEANTGSRVGFTQYDDATVRLEWTTVPVEDPFTFKFGALAPTNSAPLSFLNADEFVTTAEFIMNLRAASAARFEANLSLLAVPATAANGGPSTNHAAMGACLEIALKSLTGPVGASLAFWGTNESQPAFSVPVGEAIGTNCLRISKTTDPMTSDPYGRVTQRISASQPGLYCLEFQLVDRSTNGPGGGPIHQPSEEYHVYLQAGLTVATAIRQGQAFTAVFGGETGQEFHLERRSALNAPAPWISVAGPVMGTNRLLRLTDPAASDNDGLYRLRSVTLP